MIKEKEGEENSIKQLFLWILAILWSSIILLPSMVVAIFLPDTAFKIVPLWCRGMRKIFGIKVSVKTNSPPKCPSKYPPKNLLAEPGPHLFILLNQSSLLESFVIWDFFPNKLKCITNVEYIFIPLWGWFVTLCRHIIIVRQWKSQARRGVDRAVKYIKKGYHCFISIEGKRSRDGGLAPYKKGASVIAIKAGCKIVPVYIYGGRDLMPYGSWKIARGQLIIELLEPIDAKNYSMNDRQVLTDHLYQLGLERFNL